MGSNDIYNANTLEFENAIANQLNHLGQLQYYQKKSGQEIDFILNGKIGIEVKETPIASDLSTLNQRAKSIDLDKKILIGRYPPASGFKEFVWGGVV